ncbi:MAG: molybdopterin molybdotransferase MoeA [Clostridiales bacterium]|nr:molybdopterin molybdotransferase MoeA [Clostridiales bacterium]
MKLLNVLTLEEARTRLSACVRQIPRRKISVPLTEAADHILARDITVPFDVPGFRRSAVDGYALIASDTHGAGDVIPVFLKITEQVHIGEKPQHAVTHGECAYVPTGGMLPDGADAMVMVEYCDTFSDSDIAVSRAVASGNHVVLPGDDMKKGEILLPKETRLRFQEIGALAAMGITSVPVYEPCTATIISTGNELLPPGAKRNIAQIYDSNTYALSIQVEHAGLRVLHRYLVPDDRELLRQTLISTMADSDFVILSGGSSQGAQDMTEDLFSEVTDGSSREKRDMTDIPPREFPCGVYAHGLALKPGKPTVLAWDNAGKTALIGLPGHPAAASMVFELLVSRVLKYPSVAASSAAPDSPASAEPSTAAAPSASADPSAAAVPSGTAAPSASAEPSLPAVLSVNIASSPGRETCVPVRLADSGGTLLATPVLGPSGLWSPLVRADGYILIDKNREGLPAGSPVDVYLLGR